MGWKFTGDKPIHVQLVNEISNRIIKGEYVPGMKLPSVRDFAAQASVNPNTMQRALSALERSNVQNFFSSMAELGYSKDDAISMANELKE